ncbi:unnamed protein product [Rotaria socialis]|uniref:Tetraspanin n=1 Tax=Rotaria socialis TaxID=392032 RepID=A0A820BT68_9BILA|nr:unnamed protein product [Rotaria socialis]CAF3534554.1 unnamed protein product [Rotaria socialis]CAF3635993.1 unnamed protein product [Rotaria socialis]CAF3714942.1 unnamed protein product [Rotaria socialis]CAF3740985.1 unnamed protein product [Rotaria socialis]
MACCINVARLFCTLCIFIGLTSLVQFGLGIYVAFIRNETFLINRLVKIDNYDSYLLYIILVFTGLGLISLVLSFLSIYSTIRRFKSLSLFVTVFWIFAAALNIVILIVSLLYYFSTLPKLSTLLIPTLRQPSQSINDLQSEYNCCGINGKDDYINLRLDPLPSSCCREPQCWRDSDINDYNGSNSTKQLIHIDGCFPLISRFVTIELLGLIGGIGFSVLLQILAVTFMCCLYQRFQKFDNDPNFVINHLASEKSMNDSYGCLKGSSKTIEETVEITQI